MTRSTLTRVPLDLLLADPEDAPVRLGDYLAADLTVVQLVRYFGCLPCQDWLVELDRAVQSLADGPGTVGAIAVGGSADYQARWLRDERGATLPLLLDPEQRVRDAVGADKPLGWRMLNPKGGVSYARSLRRGYRPQRITRDTVRSPGVVALDRDGTVRWAYLGTRIGDYPSLERVRAAIGAL